MTIKTVAQRLRDLRREQIRVQQTPCANCKHPYVDHNLNDRCYFPRVKLLNPNVKACRCKGFIDPAELVATV